MKSTVLLLLEPDALQLEVHVFARHGVERSERLVHEQHRGIVDEGAGDGDPLLHAAGQLPRIAMLEAGESDEGEEVHRHLLVPVATEPLDVDGQEHVVEHAPPRKEHRRLEHHSDVAPGAGDRRAPEPRLSRSRSAAGRQGS